MYTYRGLVFAVLASVLSVVQAEGDVLSCPSTRPVENTAAREPSGDLYTRPESTVPPAKRTKRGLYVTAKDAHDMVALDPARVLFIDVRTRGELQFIGMPTMIDAHVPFLIESAPPQWDEVKSTFRLAANPRFVADVDTRLAKKGLMRDDVVIVMCQSGLRAAGAADALTDAGYTKVYTTIDGFEGDPMAEGPHKGERIVDGWRNAGLPWTTRLDRSKMYGLD
ncbi:MAG TPA: rhodanese-like domain-containing protein [Burkholderiaceae bacterium]|nr:rhodanese-like domain-containing protein [Burkholderiaceae bacterium]